MLKLNESNTNYVCASGDSLGCIQGPVCDIISEPWVARKTLGEKRIMAAVGGAVLHYTANTQ